MGVVSLITSMWSQSCTVAGGGGGGGGCGDCCLIAGVGWVGGMAALVLLFSCWKRDSAVGMLGA